MPEKVLFYSLRKRCEKLYAHTRFLIAAFFPVPDHECRHLNLMLALCRKYQVHVCAHRGRRIRIYEHAIHGNISAAGNHVIPGMDEIHSEVHRETPDNTPVAACHPFSPNIQVSYDLIRLLGSCVYLLRFWINLLYFYLLLR